MPLADAPRPAFAPGDDLGAIVARWAQSTPSAPALIHGERRVTYAELGSRMDRAAAALFARGVRRGHRVAVLSENSLGYVEVFFGALRIGASVVPLPVLASRDALGLMLRDSTPRILFSSSLYRNAVDPGDVPWRVGFDFDDARFGAYSSFLAEARDPPPDIAIAADDEFDVIYSSGTTGVPKGIVHDHGARKASYAGSRAAYFSRETVNAIATPFYSNTTCITWFLTTAAGGTNVVLGKFSPEAFLHAVERDHVTHAMLVPVQYDRILSAPAFREANLSSLRVLFSTSAPLRAEAKRRILDETPAELVEIYGLTEGGPVTVLEARRHPDKLGSVGVPAPGCEIKIVDDAGRDAPAGQAGEVIGRSTNMMSGYLNRPEETAALLFRDERGRLFLKTGDIGRVDADGFLFLLDRKKDVIISGGFNVYATDLEVVLAAHPDVREVAVIGVPSERWGETPLALVVPRAGASTTPEMLRDYVNERVGKAQRVSGVEFREGLPKNAIGKVLKRELREAYLATQLPSPERGGNF